MPRGLGPGAPRPGPWAWAARAAGPANPPRRHARGASLPPGSGETLDAALGAPAQARLDWRPQNTVEVDEKQAETLLKMLDNLEDSDDVQRVAQRFIRRDIVAISVVGPYENADALRALITQ